MDATWDDYLEVDGGTDKNFILDLYYKLPPTWDSTIDITGMNVLMNSMGPQFSDQKRTMKVRLGKSWINIGDNSQNLDWTWTYQSMMVPAQTDMYSYFNKNNAVRLRLQSNNKFDVVDIDYLVVELEYMGDDNVTPATSNPTQAPTAGPTTAPITIATPTTGPTVAPTSGPTVDGNTGMPTSIRQLGECQGSCSSTFNDCDWGLACWTDQDQSRLIPGCNQINRVPGANYCYNPTSPDELILIGVGGTPAANYPLGKCQGHCLTNSDCAGTLECFIRDGVANSPTASVEGCTGSGISGYNYCFQSTSTPPNVGQFEVKTANDLPAANVDIAAGNPLRGMMTSPNWVSYNQQNPNMPTSLDYYYIGLDTTMTGNNLFDWATLEQKLNQSANQNRHAIVRFILDYPNQANYVPQYLIDQGLTMTTYSNFGGGNSPDYSSPILLTALEQFITAFGANYDGDSRLAFIQIGLLGFWGEWHTYPHETWIPDSTKNSVSQWFDDAFEVTPLQVRYAHPSASTHKYGFHDDSFAHSTLSDTTGWFFWPEVQAMTPDYTNFWKQAVMGGELRPELQATAFSSTFPDPNNEFEQDFDLCVDTTHATYMLNNYAFSTGYSGGDLTRALASANRMGYQFRVSEVVASTNAGGTVDLDIQIMQAGIAPFYYKLGLKVTCDGNDWSVPSGVEGIIEQGSAEVFSVSGLPKTASCLNNVVISLDCPHAYPGNPVKFAQGTGNDNGKVVLSFTVPP